MSEFSHDTADEGFHEIQLSGKQLVFLFILVTFALVVTFLCGVLVGRGARVVRGDDAGDTTVASTATPGTPQAMGDSGPPAAEPPAPAPEDELSYPKRLQATDAPKEDLQSAPSAAARQTAAVPPPTAAQKAAAPPKPDVQQKTDAQPPAGEVASSGRPGAWVVQVVALQDRAVATALVQRLNGKGYPAFLVTTAPGSVPRMYKVQVGRYNDRREADQIRLRLEKEEQFKPWISR